MSDNFIHMQHASKGSAGFSHGDVSVESDADGIISIPAHLASQAKSHGFQAEIVAKAPKPVLAKAAKGADDAVSDGTDKLAEGEPVKAKGAKAAKGGAE